MPAAAFIVIGCFPCHSVIKLGRWGNPLCRSKNEVHTGHAVYMMTTFWLTDRLLGFVCLLKQSDAIYFIERPLYDILFIFLLHLYRYDKAESPVVFPCLTVLLVVILVVNFTALFFLNHWTKLCACFYSKLQNHFLISRTGLRGFKCGSHGSFCTGEVTHLWMQCDLIHKKKCNKYFLTCCVVSTMLTDEIWTLKWAIKLL